MSIKHDTSTALRKENATIYERLRNERERLKFSQARVGGRLGVSRATYMKYESGETAPNACQLSELADMGFDIYYIVVGERSANELGAELCNLVDAYSAAAPALKLAAFAVLLSAQYKEIGACQVVGGYVEQMLRLGAGLGDGHYENHVVAPRTLQDTPSPKVPGDVNEMLKNRKTGKSD